MSHLIYVMSYGPGVTAVLMTALALLERHRITNDRRKRSQTAKMPGLDTWPNPIRTPASEGLRRSMPPSLYR